LKNLSIESLVGRLEMNVMKKKGIFLLLSVTLLVFGCKKVIDPPPKIVEGIVTISFPPLEDSLTSLFAVWAVQVSVNGTEVSTIFDIAPDPSLWPNTEEQLTLEAGSDRIFTAYGLDPTSSVLWWAQKKVDLPEKEEFDVKLTLVPAGLGSASHFVVFRDTLSWDANTIEEIFWEEGITNEYEIKTSSEFSSVLTDLDPDNDMIIIAADQEQSFYDNYAASLGDIAEFVARGGVLFFEAVDRGFNNGSINDADIIFPGFVQLEAQYSFEDYNTVFNRNFTLTRDLPRPDSVHGNLASHGSFRFLSPNTQTFTSGTAAGNATLVLYPYLAGWVLLSTQPLEFNYAQRRGQHDDRMYAIGLLLPRIIRFFLGKSVT
jgi:hypothetical protein